MFMLKYSLSSSNRCKMQIKYQKHKKLNKAVRDDGIGP